MAVKKLGRELKLVNCGAGVAGMWGREGSFLRRRKIMSRYDDWFNRRNDYEKEQIERDIHYEDWDSLNEYEKSQIYEEEK